MSKRIKERTKELASKEMSIKKKLIGESGSFKSKANQIGSFALLGGGIALGVYVFYKVFFQDSEKLGKKKKEATTSQIRAEKLIVFLMPYLGKFLDRLLNELRISKKRQTQSKR